MASSAVALLEALKAQPEVARLLAASGLAHASPAVLGAALLATLLALLAVLASLSKALFGRKDLPPTVACLPVVGGFIRFLKARCCVAAARRTRRVAPTGVAPCSRARCPRPASA